MNRLVTIPISHYCEKARWALDRAAIDYIEDQHLQIFHYAATLWAGGGVTAPVLTHATGVLPDSNAIMRWVDAQRRLVAPLYPADRLGEVEAWVHRFDEELGVPGRLIMYQETLSYPVEMVRWIAGSAPAYQSSIFTRGFSLARRYAKARLGVSAEAAKRAHAQCMGLFDEVHGLLKDGRLYLLGEAFTAADLAFAALASPLVIPPQYGIPLPTVDELPASYAAIARPFREHPAGRYALRLYETERHLRAPTC
jgi:glutathione S-transferase